MNFHADAFVLYVDWQANTNIKRNQNRDVIRRDRLPKAFWIEHSVTPEMVLVWHIYVVLKVKLFRHQILNICICSSGMGSQCFVGAGQFSSSGWWGNNPSYCASKCLILCGVIISQGSGKIIRVSQSEAEEGRSSLEKKERCRLSGVVQPCACVEEVLPEGKKALL